MTYYIEYIEGTAARITEQPPFDPRFISTSCEEPNKLSQVLNLFNLWLGDPYRNSLGITSKNITQAHEKKAQHLLSLCL